MSNNPFGPANSSFNTTNNPFVLASDPNDPSNRFPKIDADGGIQVNPMSSQSFQGQQAYPAQSFNGNYSQQQQLPFTQQQQNPYISAQPTGGAFRASSSFGQQLEAHYGPGPLQATNTGIGARAQTSTPLYQNVADLDPYASLAQLPWAQPTPQAQQQQTPASPTSSSFGGAPSFHEDHPRSFVRAHKQELEKWDAQIWKQFLNSVTKLKDAWTLRQSVVIKATELYNKQWTPEDANRCQTLLQEADSNIDTIAASEFQLSEVESGYRHSSDAASRSRVREALNAGLRALPEWPEELQTSAGVTVAYANPGQYGYQQQQPQPQQYQPAQQQFQQQQQLFQLPSQPTGYTPQQMYPQYTGWQQPQQFAGFR